MVPHLETAGSETGLSTLDEQRMPKTSSGTSFNQAPEYIDHQNDIWLPIPANAADNAVRSGGAASNGAPDTERSTNGIKSRAAGAVSESILFLKQLLPQR
jgi:hypothetical protein